MKAKPPKGLSASMPRLSSPGAGHSVLHSGVGAASGTNRVKRGGSWNNNASNCTVSNRNNNNPNNQNNNIGFRVVRP